MSQWLKPLKKSPRHFVVGAFDFETTGVSADFDCGSAVVNGDGIYTRDLNDLLSFMSQKRYRKVLWYSHNLAYDIGAVCLDLPYSHKLYFTNGYCFKGWIHVERRGRIKLRDSLQLMAHLPLATLGNCVGLLKYERPPEYGGGGEDVDEWYCERHNRLWCPECYNTRDAEIVVKAVEEFQREVNCLGGEVKSTLAGTAFDLFRRAYLDGEYLVPFPWRNEFARNAYYGGRVEAFGLGSWDGVYVYDFHSLYPSVMVEGEFPDPNYLVGPTIEVPPGVVDKYEGVSEVEVDVDRTFVPPLPYRGKNKLYFPYGRWRGVYTHVELRYAQEQGVKVRRVFKSLYSERSCKPFARYVKSLYNLRVDYKSRGDPRQLYVKILLNSLYGRFGLNSGHRLEYLVTEDWVAEHGVPYGALPVIYYDKCYFRVPVYIAEQSDCVNVLWAAYISSLARIRLHKYIVNCPHDVIYCDTDSIFCLGSYVDEPGLGGLGLEVANAHVDIYGPKLYRIVDDEGNERFKAKGIPERVKEKYLREKACTYEKPLQFFEAARRHLAPSMWIQVTKIVRDKEPKRKVVRSRRGDRGRQWTAPFHVSEIPRPQSGIFLL